jgi:hypothetical protein
MRLHMSKLYRESQKTAENGKIIDYPVATLTIEEENKVICQFRNTITPNKKVNLFNGLEFYHRGYRADGVTPDLSLSKTANGCIEMKGNLQQAITELLDLRYISQTTYNSITSDYKLKTEIAEKNCNCIIG